MRFLIILKFKKSLQMFENCEFHSKPFIFLCYESRCHKFLCLNCINDHQRACHSPSNTYQDLIPIEDIPSILQQRMQKMHEKISHIFLHKKDLLLNYFFDHLSEITDYYLENLNKNISHEPLEIIQVSGNEYLNDLKDKLNDFLDNKKKNLKDYIYMLQETDINNAINKIKTKETSLARTKYPDLRKAFDEIEIILDRIEHCFLDFKKKSFTESYALEMNQMLNLVANTEENQIVISQPDSKQEEFNIFDDADMKQILMDLESCKAEEIIKENNSNKIQEKEEIKPEAETQEIKQEQITETIEKIEERKPEVESQEIMREQTTINIEKIEEIKQEVETQKINQEKITEAVEKIEQKLLNTSEIEINGTNIKNEKLEEITIDDKNKLCETNNAAFEKQEEIKIDDKIKLNETNNGALDNEDEQKEDDKKEKITKDDGVLIDYDLEEFEYSLESFNPENPYLFLHYMPLISSNYFRDIIELACKRIFSEDFDGINSTEEGFLKSKSFFILSTSGKYMKIEQEENDNIEVYLLNIQLTDNNKYDIMMSKKGLQFMLPFEKENHFNFNINDSEKKINYSEEFLTLLKEKYAVKLEGNLNSRCPLSFDFKKYLIQINETYDKIRIIDKLSGFRSFIRNFGKGLCLKDFDVEMIFEYIAFNNAHILHLEDFDIFLNMSNHSNFIIFNRKYEDLFIINLITPELIIVYMDLLFNDCKCIEEVSIELLLKSLLFNSDVKFRNFTEGEISSESFEVLLENGDIQVMKNVERCGVICCNFTMKIHEAVKKKCIYVLKANKQVILAFHEKTIIKKDQQNESQIFQPYDDDLTAILRIAQYFVKLNVEIFLDSLLQFDSYFIISIVNDNSSFYMRRLQDNTKNVLLFYQEFHPNQLKNQQLTEQFFGLLDSLSDDLIYKESNNIQFLFKIKTNELWVRWNGHNVNLFTLENKRNEIVKISKSTYQKKDKEKRPETLKKKIIIPIISENEI